MSDLVRQPVANVIEVGFASGTSGAAGVGKLVGQLFGIPEHDFAIDATSANMRVRGAVQIAKAGSLAVAIGDVLYWDDSGKVVNKTASNKEVGLAYSSTSNGAGEVTCNMLIVQTLRGGTGS